MAEILPIDNILAMNLTIPNYQRPYKWQEKNVLELLFDLKAAIDTSNKADYEDFRYRLGTILLHKTDGKTFDIVDGQQRLLTLSLLKLVLNKSYSNSLLKHNFADSASKANIKQNYAAIKEWLIDNPEKQEAISSGLASLFEAVVITVDEVDEAFQLFDSQNTRGKELDPTDLLKAHHLRCFKEGEGKIKLINGYEVAEPKDIHRLFSTYLFPILNWSKKEKTHRFSSGDLAAYKGTDRQLDYPYAKRIEAAGDNFQITEPFVAGPSYFHFVDHCLKLKKAIGGDFKAIDSIIEEGRKKHSIGFEYAVSLFECALLAHKDRFGKIEPAVAEKLFAWAMMARVDRQTLGFDSINNYAIGEGNSFTNSIPAFTLIEQAVDPKEITGLKITIKDSEYESWRWLSDELKKLLGVN